MCLVEDIPVIFRFIFKFYGIIQSSCKPTKFSPRFWCLPTYLIFSFSCFRLYQTISKFASMSLFFKDLDRVVNFLCIIPLGVTILIANFRSNKLKKLLVKLQDLEITKSCRYDMLEILLFISIIITYILMLFFDDWDSHMFYYMAAPTLGCLDHLFLNEILKRFQDQFEAINTKLQKITIRKDLFEIFSLTRQDKIQKFKDRDNQIKTIQNLSLLHYDLVNLAYKINNLFGITTIVSMLVLFVFTIDITYIILYHWVKSIEPHPTTLFWYFGFCDIFFILWLLVMVRMFSRTENLVIINNFTKKKIYYFRLITLLSIFTTSGTAIYSKEESMITCNIFN